MTLDKEQGGPPKEPPISFEEAFGRLEETVQALEAGNLTLEEATRLYEAGMSLARLCNQVLNATELRITQLRNAYSEYLVETPIEDEE